MANKSKQKRHVDFSGTKQEYSILSKPITLGGLLDAWEQLPDNGFLNVKNRFNKIFSY